MKQRIFEIIEPANNDDKASLLFDRIIVIMILINVLAIILESFESLSLSYGSTFRIIEVISVAVFTVEYVLRIWTAPLKYKSISKTKSVYRQIKSPMAIIDLLAILPFYLPMFIPIDLRFLRIIRLTRMFRLFKLNRYNQSLNMLSRVIQREKEHLQVTLFVTFLLLLIASTLMYTFENHVQPEAFSNIVETFWWAIATLTTVGYGDVYPITAIGKVLSGIIALLGIGVVALPTGILSSGFLQELNDRKVSESDKCTCPHCGKTF
ncbi:MULTISPECIES: ion transporter [unclassified Fusibacter]|uniref:ion transporter n=1 Tax=unclassified Fusibacter TaxID=2624464 RepID=UPI0010112F2A|nr:MULTISPECIES: ion transporter [unclassified Fusibacter]MCK8061630.1 ion transporter [Fusibacter sp. A2]NPE23814.1 ion transporter [Fusibacter sp. A1]RXV58652.1 ion transporter [Fusibacter sp. A1]